MIIYDAGALVAAERNARSMWALHDAALRRDLSPVVPAGVLAQAWRGHASIGITLDTYSHVLPDRDAEVAATLATAIFGE